MTQNLMASTVLQGSVLAATTLATTVAIPVYAVEAGAAAIINKGLAYNNSASPVGLTVSIVENGGAAVDVLKFNLPANLTAVLDELEGLRLGPLDGVTFTATAGAVVNIVLSGTENN